MTVRVITSSRNSTGSIVIKKGDNLTVQGLSDVVSTNLQDGFTLIYNSTTKKWITQAVANVSIQTVDGGTY